MNSLISDHYPLTIALDFFTSVPKNLPQDDNWYYEYPGDCLHVLLHYKSEQDLERFNTISTARGITFL
jgi:hypothetical protein